MENRPKLTPARALRRWRELREAGVPAGSANREMRLLRDYLRAIGRWREIQ